ncbi:MAG TPA: TIGR04211 family SH3 domain-containing protein [Sedimenticola sp.]|nr:TIGR04211 family SH3 domain-containing protein [Sedimenticola sp.]
MRKSLPLITGLLLLSMAFPAPAAYITDKLLAGLYENPDPDETPVQVLPSGTPLEILEARGDFSRVRLTDRTEGWVETLLITEEKPAQVMLLELQATAGELRARLQQAEAELEQARTAAPEQQRLQEELAAANRHIEELSLALAAARPEQARDCNDILALPLWLLPAGALLALAGFIGGVIFRNYRLRKRLGGLRL